MKSNLFKTALAIFAAGCLALCLAACGKLAQPLTVPPAEEILSADVTTGVKVVTHVERSWIEQVISGLAGTDTVPTRKESTGDVPSAKEYTRMELRMEGGANSLFVYREGSKYYAERPYEGIYEIPAQLYLLITGPVIG